MKQAARGSGQQPQTHRQNPEQKQRDSDTHTKPPPPPAKAAAPASFYRPLPLGSEAFMAPLAPPPERRTLLSRKLVLLCALGACCGAAAGAIALTFMLRGSQTEVEDVGLGAMPEPSAATPGDDARPAMKTVAAQASAHLDRAIERSEREEAQAATADAPAVQEPATAQDTERAEDERTTAAATAPEVNPKPADEGRADRAGKKRSRRAAQREAPAIEKPSRAQVLAAMSRVQGRVKACFGGTHGTVTADVTVLGRTGRITTANVTGQPGPIGSCVARAVRKARFPKFRAESITIRYPMQH